MYHYFMQVIENKQTFTVNKTGDVNAGERLRAHGNFIQKNKKSQNRIEEAR